MQYFKTIVSITLPTLISMALFMESGCQAVGHETMETPNLPGRLIVYDPYANKHLKYVAQKENPLVPVSGFTDQYDLTYSPKTSPDGRWTLSYDESNQRYVVSGANSRFSFLYFCFAPSQIAWSPDSQFIVYRADDDEGKWTSRIMVMSLKDGKTWWIGNGDSPRWYSSSN